MPDNWHPHYLVIPRRVGGKWKWLQTVERRLTLYPNTFALAGFAFHAEYRPLERQN